MLDLLLMLSHRMGSHTPRKMLSALFYTHELTGTHDRLNVTDQGYDNHPNQTAGQCCFLGFWPWTAVASSNLQSLRNMTKHFSVVLKYV